jgi:hypothetical protein
MYHLVCALLIELFLEKSDEKEVLVLIVVGRLFFG